MMASVILVVGFIGMVEALGLGSNMMDHARRQTLADQMIKHEIEKLHLANWTTLNALTSATDITKDPLFDPNKDAGGTTYLGATYQLDRTVTSPDPFTNIKEVKFTVTWSVTIGRQNASAGTTRQTFTYSRSNWAYFGKYGLNYTYQRS